MRTIETLVQEHALFIEQAVRTRLYDKGTYADGKQIKTYSATGSFVYAPATVNFRGAEGKQTDHVDLNDTGRLYESFDVETGSSSFVVDYDDNKSDGNVSDNIPDLDEAIKLGDEGLIELRELIKEDLRHDFKQEAQQALHNGFK